MSTPFRPSGCGTSVAAPTLPIRRRPMRPPQCLGGNMSRAMQRLLEQCAQYGRKNGDDSGTSVESTGWTAPFRNAVVTPPSAIPYPLPHMGHGYFSLSTFLCSRSTARSASSTAFCRAFSRKIGGAILSMVLFGSLVRSTTSSGVKPNRSSCFAFSQASRQGLRYAILTFSSFSPAGRGVKKGCAALAHPQSIFFNG